MMAKPVYVGILRGKPLRFYRPPHTQPAFPWHAVTDFLLAVDLPRALRRTFEAGLGKQWKAETKMIDTPTGIVTIGPHFMAQGLIDGLVETQRVTEALEQEYVALALQALDAMIGYMGPEERLDFVLRAAKHGADRRAA